MLNHHHSSQIPPGLPQTRIGAYFAMFALGGWLVVVLVFGIPVIYICFTLLASILGF